MTFATIDAFLALAPVRWLLLTTAVILAVGFGFMTLRAWTLIAQIEAVKKERDHILTAVAVQNEAIRRSVAISEDMAEKVKTAQVLADQIRENTRTTVAGIIRSELKGACPEMIANSVRLLQGENSEK